MSAYWPFWLGGVFLAALPIVHWLLLRRMFAVSSRYTALTDWLRGRSKQSAAATSEPLDEAALLEALQQETAAAFGTESTVAAEPTTEPVAAAIPSAIASGLTPHLVFLGSVVLGGAVAAWTATGQRPAPHAPSGLFTTYFGTNPLVDFLILVAGGFLVGFGTRMAGGCTSGHGLCGTSRLQPGSLLSTACFFGMAIAASFALQVLFGGGR